MRLLFLRKRNDTTAEDVLAAFGTALGKLESARMAFREARGPAEVDRAVFALLVAERELVAVLDEAKRKGVRGWLFARRLEGG